MFNRTGGPAAAESSDAAADSANIGADDNHTESQQSDCGYSVYDPVVLPDDHACQDSDTHAGLLADRPLYRHTSGIHLWSRVFQFEGVQGGDTHVRQASQFQGNNKVVQVCLYG